MNRAETFWDRTAQNFDKSEKRFEQIHLKTLENSKKYLDTDDIVLDYGCATGTKAFELAGYVKKIQGIDISSKMIEAAKRKTVECKIENVDFAQATIFDKQYNKASFDVILAFNILHVLEDSRQAVQRITELLKPGGLFISITPCLKEEMTFLNNFELLFYRLLIKIGLVPNILRRFKISELEGLISQDNLQVIETENISHRMSSYFVVAKKI